MKGNAELVCCEGAWLHPTPYCVALDPLNRNKDSPPILIDMVHGTHAYSPSRELIVARSATLTVAIAQPEDSGRLHCILLSGKPNTIRMRVEDRFCPPQQNSSHLSVYLTRRNLFIGTVARFFCPVWYKPHTTATYENDGTWSHSPPECHAMTERTILMFDVVYDVFDDFLPEFHRWNDLPVDVKLYILKYLTFPTLRGIMFLSKECYDLVRKIKPKVDLHLEDAAFLPTKKQRKLAKNDDGVKLHIYWRKPGAGPNPVHDYPLMFIKDSEEGCFVQRKMSKKGKYRKRPGMRYSSNTITAATKAMFWFSKVLDIQATTISMPSPNADLQAVLAEQSSSLKIAKENFTMRTDNEPLITIEFLRFLKPGCGISVVMNNRCRLFRGLELFNHEIFQCARKISLHHWKAVLRDYQLINLAAEDIYLHSSYITSEAINRLILEWLEEKRKIRFVQLKEVQDLDLEVILRNVDPTAIMLWRDFVKKTSYNGAWNFEDKPASVVKGPQGFLVLRADADTGDCVLVDAYVIP